MLNILPRTGGFLLQTKGNLLTFLIDTDNNTFDFLVKLNYLRGM